MSRPRLILADDHEIVLEGLQRLLRPEFDVIGSAADGIQVLQLCRTLKPDVVVMDIGMPRMGGMEVAEILSKSGAMPRMIFLTMQSEAELAVRAFRLGVMGFAMKHAASAELFTAIREVLAGRTFISPRIGKDLVQACLGPAPETTGSASPFTPRQAEVVRLIAQGKTMKEVAGILGISTRTAEAHKYQTMEKHRIRTVAELIQLGIRTGVIEMTNPDPATLRPPRPSR